MAEVGKHDEPQQHRGSSEARAERHASRAAATYRRFVHAIAEEGGYSNEDAETCAIAVVATLEERLPLDEVWGLEAQLPSLLAEMLEREPIVDLPRMDSHQLCKRVAIRLGVTEPEAESIARIVFHVLRTRVSVGEARHIEARLPADLKHLWRDT